MPQRDDLYLIRKLAHISAAAAQQEDGIVARTEPRFFRNRFLAASPDERTAAACNAVAPGGTF